MPDFHIVEGRPGSDWIYDRLHALELAINLEQLGEDLTTSPDRLRASYSDERNAIKGMLLVLPGSAPAGAEPGRFGVPEASTKAVDLLGGAEFMLPTADNTHLLDNLYCQVRADARRGGVGTALWREIVRIAGDRGRSTIVGWTQHLAGRNVEGEPLRPATGVGHLPVDEASRFAGSRGLSLSQVERQSRLPLPVSPGFLDGLRADAEAHALPAYRVVSWLGQTPEEYLDGVAMMNHTLSVDAPIGDLDWEPEAWDAERVRHGDERAHLTGQSVYTMAMVAGSPEVAALTQIHVHDVTPERPEQWTTVVAKAHRGHRLGMLIKAVNLQLLAAEFPLASHLDTWNAGENDHMLAINTRIGFRLHSVHGAWQTRLL